jgi:hypothetical protein
MEAEMLMPVGVAGRTRIAGFILRVVFVVSLVIWVAHLSMPETKTVWRVYESPSDFFRIMIGVALCAWIAAQLLRTPKAEALQTWLYLGPFAVPFALLCIVGTW